MIEFQKSLSEGKAVILPTETVYGLFATALNEQAVNRVYSLKKRPRDKAMNLNVSRFEDILAFSTDQPSYLKTLYDAFLPGPLTIILKANDKVPEWINSGLGTVGFRVPNHPVTLELIRKFKVLIGPSANISGQSSGLVFDDIVADFNNQVTGYKDDEALTAKDSTILDLSSQKARILRQGAITKKQILEVVPEVDFSE